MLIYCDDKNEIKHALANLLKKQAFAHEPAQQKIVSRIIRDVIRSGDEAVVKYTRQFDLPAGRQGLKKYLLADLVIPAKKLENAHKKVSRQFRAALTKASQNIKAYHLKQKPDEWFETLPLDVVLGQRVIPLERVGIYVPGGRAAYPSSVLMNAIPAKVAGVKEIIMVSPPPIKAEVLVAAAEVGVSSIFAVGGAQAIAALAYGTKTIPRVDKIVGPGNVYVTLAKKQVMGQVGIDGLAGPSNVVIIADQDSQPEFLAADLLSQAEHDPRSFSVLITNSEKIAVKTKQQVEIQAKKLKRAAIIKQAEIYIFLVANLSEAVEISNQIAPEHLELEVGAPQRFLEKIKNAGAVFLGPHSPVPIGDYMAGPNHVLPTGGTSRFASPLGVYDFVKTQSIIGYTRPALKNVWKDIKLLASIEGLDGHAKAIDIRFRS